jgi:hypothetical protein
VPRVLHYSDLENVYDDTERIARLAGLLGELRGENALLVGSGDDLAPGVCSLSTRGGCALPFFEAVSPDVETFGSHDFDYGLDRTQEIVADSAQQWISANVSHEKGSFGANEGVISYTICESDGDRVGFVGVTDPATTDMAPGASALSISDPVAAVEEGVRELRPRVEYLCVLSHCGALDTDIARRCAVDRVLDGHVHDERITTIAGTVCTRPNANGHRICEIDLDAGEAAFRETAAGPIDEELRGVYENLPSIAPFSGGLARHHTRLFSRPDIDLTVLMGELFVPLGAADPFGSAIVEWTERNAVEEIAVLSGVPSSTAPRPTGASTSRPTITARSTTPVHARSPDIDAALRLLETVEDVYDLDIDTGPIEEFAASVSAHYERLAEHVQDTREDDRYDDRMYM